MWHPKERLNDLGIAWTHACYSDGVQRVKALQQAVLSSKSSIRRQIQAEQGAEQRNLIGLSTIEDMELSAVICVVAIRNSVPNLQMSKMTFRNRCALKGAPPLNCQLKKQFKLLNYISLNWLLFCSCMCKLVGPQHYVPKQLTLYVVLQLVQLFTNKQRTGVMELEAGLEAYIIPPCPLVGRLLRTAKKSASMASHDASLIPSALDSCQLLLAIIHKKVCVSLRIPA